MTWEWEWYQKVDGEKSKTRQYYKAIIRNDDEIIKLQNVIVFNSTPSQHLPPIGKVEEMWEDLADNTRWVRVNWYYLPQDIANNGVAGLNLKYPNALFRAIDHTDRNEIDTISHKIEVLSFNQYLLRKCEDMHVDMKGQTHFFYYAGTYSQKGNKVKLKPDIPSVTKSDEDENEAE